MGCIFDKKCDGESICKKYFDGWLLRRYAAVLCYKHHEASSACPNHPYHIVQIHIPKTSWGDEVTIGGES